MKKQFILVLILSMFLVGCSGGGGGESTNNTNPTTNAPVTSTNPSTTTSLLNFEGISFESKTSVYDGNGHTIEVKNAPVGTTIVYDNEGPHINVGTYHIEATLSKEGYNTKKYSATLTISKAAFADIVFNDVKVDYDGLDHSQDVIITSALPQNTTVTYKYYLDDVQVQECIEIGKYKVEAHLTNSNYNNQILEANLTIQAVKDTLPISYSNGNIYFANGLDGNALYSIDDNGSIGKISNDYPLQFIDYNQSLAVISKAMLFSSLKTLNIGTETTMDVKYNTGKIDYITTDGEKLYYATNLLTNNQSGIYRIDYENNEPVSTQIYSGRAKYIYYNNSSIYFADGRNDDKLAKVQANVTTKTETATILSEEKILNMVGDGNNLFFTVNGLLNDYIALYSIGSGSLKKLSNNAGNYFSISGNYLYYSNVDLLSSNIQGKGIYKLDYTALQPSSVKVVEDETGINSIYTNNTLDTLYFTRMSDLHLCSMSMTDGSITDLLEEFVAPTVVPLNQGGKNIAVGNNVYYLNMYRGKTLYVYNNVTKTNRQLTSNKVEDFSVVGNTLYINQVSYLVNNDLYSVNLTTGGTGTLLASDDARNIVADNENLYYVKHNQVGAATSLVKSNLDGSNPVEFYNKGASNLQIHNGRLYFIDGGDIYSFLLTDIKQSTTTLTPTLLNKECKNVGKFVIDGDYLFYSYKGTITKEIRRSLLTSPGSYVAIASKQTDPVDFVVSDTKVYYYSQAESAGIANYGIYEVNKMATEDSTFKMILPCASQYYASAMTLSGNYLYFLNGFYVAGVSAFGDAHVYQIDVTSSNPTPSLIG